MYGGTWYESGGAGIFKHADGPFGEDPSAMESASSSSSIVGLTDQLLADQGVAIGGKVGQNAVISVPATTLPTWVKVAGVVLAAVAVGVLIRATVRRRT